jgi:hypothetical protein
MLVLLAGCACGQNQPFTGFLYGRALTITMPTGYVGSPIFVYKVGTTVRVEIGADGSITLPAGATIDGVDLSELSTVYAPASGIAMSAVTGLSDALAGKAPSTGIAQSAVTDLVDDLAAKAPSASPTLSGTVRILGDTDEIRWVDDSGSYTRISATGIYLGLAGEVAANCSIYGAQMQSPFYLSQPAIDSWGNYYADLLIGAVNGNGGNVQIEASDAGTGPQLDGSTPNVHHAAGGFRMIGGAGDETTPNGAGIELRGGAKFGAGTDGPVVIRNAANSADIADFGTGDGITFNDDLIISGLVDGVDVSAHDHSTSTAQTRLSTKDRTRQLTWRWETNSSVTGQTTSYFAGDGSGSTGYTFPSDVHITRFSVGGNDPDWSSGDRIRCVLLKTGTPVGGNVDCDFSGTGWARASTTYPAGGIAYTSTDEFTFSCIINTKPYTDIWVVVDYTVD